MNVPADAERVITLLGGAGIHAGATPVSGRATHRHPLALIAFLIVSAGRGVTRDKLIALLWPERDAESARNLLKVNVHELRKELGDSAIRSIGDQLSADLSQLSCDVIDFHAAIARGDDASAVAVYHGPLLDGFFIKDSPEFEQWVDRERTRLAATYGAALDRLATAAESRGDLEAAVKWRRAHATHDPYHPDVAHRLVQTLAAAGDRTGAIQFAEAYVERRKRDFDLSDEHEIVAIARQLRSAYSPPAPAAKLATPATPASPATPAAATALPMAEPASQPLVLAPRATNRRRLVARGATGIVTLAAVVGVVLLARLGGRAKPVMRGGPALVAVVPFHVVGRDSALRDGLFDLLSSRFTGEAG